MPLPTILDYQQDIEPFFGVPMDNPAEYGALVRIQKFVEAAARKYVRHGIAQATYTEFQRKYDIGQSDSNSREVELIGGSAVYRECNDVQYSEYLQLDNAYARSITSLYEDSSASFGTGVSDFAAGTQLTYGTDFHLELDASGLSKSGRLIRTSRGWSSKPGTIKITYVAGLTAAELDDEYSFVKMALLDDIREEFNMVRAQRASAFGPVKKETYFGDYQVEYAIDTRARTQTGLSRKTMAALYPIMNVRL